METVTLGPSPDGFASEDARTTHLPSPGAALPGSVPLQIEACLPHLRGMITGHRWAMLRETVDPWPVSTAGSLIELLEPSERLSLLWILSPARRVAVLTRLPAAQREELLDGFSDTELARLLGACGPGELRRLLASLRRASADRVRSLLRHGRDGADDRPARSFAAGSLGERMRAGVPTVLACAGPRAALAALFASGARLDDEALVFLIDRAGRFRGWRRFGELRTADRDRAVGVQAAGQNAAAPPQAPAERALAYAAERGWPAIAVIDGAGRLLGAVGAEPGAIPGRSEDGPELPCPADGRRTGPARRTRPSLRRRPGIRAPAARSREPRAGLRTP
jgi:Mg/Co/Ni transporter MgtE